MKIVRPLIAEFLGTFTMVFCGTGAMTINEITGGSVGGVGIGISWGFIIIAMIYSFGDISGAHFNPAVTIAFAAAKKFRWQQVPTYVLVQFIGAISASLLLHFLFPASEWLGGTQPSVVPYFEPYKAFILEILLTFFLMMVIIHVSTGSKEVGIVAGLAIGGVVMLEAIFAGPMTNASMNPARSFGPALVSGHLENLWLYLIAPVIGALLAIPLCRLLKGNDCCDD